MGKAVYRNGTVAVEPFAVHRAEYVDSFRDNFPSEPNMAIAVNGQDMLSRHVENGEVVVPAGMYFVKVQTQKRKFISVKLVKI